MDIIQINALRSSLLKQEQALDRYRLTAPGLYELEARYTLAEVKKLLDGRSKKFISNGLQQLLKNRWKYLKNTDLQYCHDLMNPANLFFIDMAKVFGTILNKPYLGLLMPTLNEVPAKDYITSSYFEYLDLRHLILSDDNTRLIHVVDVLDFAKNDGQLKHNSLFAGAQRNLTLSEEHRLLTRHASVANYYQVLKQKRDFVYHGETAGAYIMRLIEGLRAGGRQGSGDEMNTGLEANVAMADFAFYLSGLDRTRRNVVLSANKVDRYSSETVEAISIRKAWRRLATPHAVDLNDTQWCVELIAGELEEILINNPKLYELLPYEGDSLSTLKQINAQVSVSAAMMLDELSKLERHIYYDGNAEQSLRLEVLDKMIGDSDVILDSDDIVFIANMYYQHTLESSSFNAIFCERCASCLTGIAARIPLQQINDVLDKMEPDAARCVAPLIQHHLPIKRSHQDKSCLGFFSGKKLNQSSVAANSTCNIKNG